MEFVLALFSFIIAGCFIGHYCIDANGAPDSVSSLVYNMKHKWVWSVWIIAVGMLLFPALMERMPDYWRFVGFLMILALVGTALTPLFVPGKEKAHYYLSNVLGVLSQLCVLIISPWWLLLWLIPIFSAAYVSLKECPRWLEGKGLFFIEVMCMVTLYCALAL